jgi:hypothetical protein
LFVSERQLVREAHIRAFIVPIDRNYSTRWGNSAMDHVIFAANFVKLQVVILRRTQMLCIKFSVQEKRKRLPSFLATTVVNGAHHTSKKREVTRTSLVPALSFRILEL